MICCPLIWTNHALRDERQNGFGKCICPPDKRVNHTAIRRVAAEARTLLVDALGPAYAIAMVDAECEIGSGALPGVLLPSCALA